MLILVQIKSPAGCLRISIITAVAGRSPGYWTTWTAALGRAWFGAGIGGEGAPLAPICGEKGNPKGGGALGPGILGPIIRLLRLARVQGIPVSGKRRWLNRGIIPGNQKARKPPDPKREDFFQFGAQKFWPGGVRQNFRGDLLRGGAKIPSGNLALGFPKGAILNGVWGLGMARAFWGFSPGGSFPIPNTKKWGPRLFLSQNPPKGPKISPGRN